MKSLSVAASTPAFRRLLPAIGFLVLLAGCGGHSHGARQSSAAAAANAIDGFRSAQFGMDQDQVTAAIAKDFHLGADSIRSADDPHEHTTQLSIAVPELLDNGGTAEVTYILGYASHRLIEVDVIWSKATDPSLTPERLQANAQRLGDYFTARHYRPDTVNGGVPVANGLLVFRASDAKGHAVLLTLTQQPGDGPANLNLDYVADPEHPDIYRVAPGQF